ncbi:MAG: ABC transporter ATP-binding protein [Clostridia bacterium]|nr:ABC transporter ATP-binding protein [Oscillospiraceae bacterium]MBR2411554.1 ABC transporter ATP-binding protein [Clostridia bacterium]
MIEIKNISKSFDGKQILDNVSFSVKKGECVAIMGRSGVGKTTLLRIIAGLEVPDGGEIIFSENARKTFVFQENRLLENKSVTENILAVAPDRKRAEYFLERCGLSDSKDKKAGTLSGGMKRRLSIARALSFGGDVYFLDEPLRELDEDTLNDIACLIKEEITGKTAILITHDEDSAKMLSDRIVYIEN